TVQAVHRVVMEAEKEYYIQEHVKKLDQVFVRTDEAIAAAAIYTAQHLKVKAIAALTQSGNAAQWLSRADSEMPIYALSPDKYARRKLTLHRGVYPFPIEQGNKNKDEILQEMEQVLLQQKAVSLGDIVLLTFGEPIGSPGGTNTLKIIKVGENKQA
ncbi:MAG: pyruvate kinase alpha/beta domain-containing protein, partial [Methylotenera sp.]